MEIFFFFFVYKQNKTQSKNIAHCAVFSFSWLLCIAHFRNFFFVFFLLKCVFVLQQKQNKTKKQGMCGFVFIFIIELIRRKYATAVDCVRILGTWSALKMVYYFRPKVFIIFIFFFGFCVIFLFLYFTLFRLHLCVCVCVCCYVSIRYSCVFFGKHV